ncbi:MAG: hypothetical protein IPM56_16145 [Ignavibacteriales bacterium]|nr:MAG: hypothetical protein IPM56_16145 [Ignavibacteriales bacterium]
MKRSRGMEVSKNKFVWLKDITGKPVRVLKESLHKYELSFLAAGNDVAFDSKRHVRR